MIGFLHPWVLLGLAAAAIPVLLHLLARREPPTVVFPAVRYLVSTTREHQRRLKLQNWLLLLLRTLLIVLLVLAAAAPSVALSGVPGHAPSALVLILDNSPSSGTVIDGSPQLRRLLTAARQVLARANPEDRLWLITADGIPRRGDRGSLGQVLAGLRTSPRRLDLGAAVTLAGDVLGSEPRPGEIMLLTAVSGAASRAAPRGSAGQSASAQYWNRIARSGIAAMVLGGWESDRHPGRRLRSSRPGQCQAGQPPCPPGTGGGGIRGQP
jgi:hypothetical protein